MSQPEVTEEPIHFQLMSVHCMLKDEIRELEAKLAQKKQAAETVRKVISEKVGYQIAAGYEIA